MTDDREAEAPTTDRLASVPRGRDLLCGSPIGGSFNPRGSADTLASLAGVRRFSRRPVSLSAGNLADSDPSGFGWFCSL